MNPIKMLGLAALAALATMAFTGATTAMAEPTALCDIDPGTGALEVCPAGHLLVALHEANLPGSKVKLLFGIITVECDVLFQGVTAEALRNPQLIGGVYTYTNCTNNCKITETNGPSIIEMLKEGHEKAKVTIGFQIIINCAAMNCGYVGAPVGKGWGPLLSLEANGEISIQEAQIFRTEGALCPLATVLDLRTTPLVKTYITR